MNFSALTPLFVQVILTIVLALGMAYHRGVALRTGTRVEDIGLRQPNWPVTPTKWANAYANQFELPVLFYVLVILALMTRQATNLFVMLAWAFVAMRVAQAVVHVTTNKVHLRALLFGIGFAILAIMWGMFILAILVP